MNWTGQGKGQGMADLQLYFASLSAINIAMHICMCAAHRSNMSYGNLSVLYDKLHIHSYKNKYVCVYIFVQYAVLADLSIVYRSFCFEWPTK